MLRQVAPQIHLLSPDSKASWKNVGLYEIRIFWIQRTNKMESVMNGLMGHCPQNFWAKTAPIFLRCGVKICMPRNTAGPACKFVTIPFFCENCFVAYNSWHSVYSSSMWQITGMIMIIFLSKNLQF